MLKKTETRAGDNTDVIRLSPPHIGIDTMCGSVSFIACSSIRLAASSFASLLAERLDRFRHSDHHCHRINR